MTQGLLESSDCDDDLFCEFSGVDCVGVCVFRELC